MLDKLQKNTTPMPLGWEELMRREKKEWQDEVVENEPSDAGQRHKLYESTLPEKPCIEKSQHQPKKSYQFDRRMPGNEQRYLNPGFGN